MLTRSLHDIHNRLIKYSVSGVFDINQSPCGTLHNNQNEPKNNEQYKNVRKRLFFGNISDVLKTEISDLRHYSTYNFLAITGKIAYCTLYIQLITVY